MFAFFHLAERFQSSPMLDISSLFIFIVAWCSIIWTQYIFISVGQLRLTPRGEVIFFSGPSGWLHTPADGDISGSPNQKTGKCDGDLEERQWGWCGGRWITEDRTMYWFYSIAVIKYMFKTTHRIESLGLLVPEGYDSKLFRRADWCVARAET